METIEVRLVGEAAKDACAAYGLHPGAMNRSVSLLGVQCTLHFDELGPLSPTEVPVSSPHTLLACFYLFSPVSLERLKVSLLPQLQADYPGADIMLLGVPTPPGKDRPTSPPNSEGADSLGRGANFNVSEALNSAPISLGRARQLNQTIGNSGSERKRLPEFGSPRDRHLSTDSKSLADPLVGFQEVTFANQDPPPLSVGSEAILSDATLTGPRPTSVSSLDSFGDTTSSATLGSTPASTSERGVISSSSFGATSFTNSSSVMSSSLGSSPLSSSMDPSSPLMRWRSRHHPSQRVLPDPLAQMRIATEKAQEVALQLSLPLFVAPEYEPLLFSSPPGSFSAASVPPAIAALISSVTASPQTPTAPIATTSAPIATATANTSYSKPESPNTNANVALSSSPISTKSAGSTASPPGAAAISTSPVSSSTPISNASHVSFADSHSTLSFEPTGSASAESPRAFARSGSAPLQSDFLRTSATSVGTPPTTASGAITENSLPSSPSLSRSQPSGLSPRNNNSEENIASSPSFGSALSSPVGASSMATAMDSTHNPLKQQQEETITSTPERGGLTNSQKILRSETTSIGASPSNLSLSPAPGSPSPASSSHNPSAFNSQVAIPLSPQTVAAASQVIAFFEALATAYQPTWLKQSITSYKKLGLDISIADKKTIAFMELWRPFSQHGADQVTGMSLRDLGLKSSLPDFVSQLTNLVSINLSGNNLNESHIKVLFQLPLIYTLNLSKNQIKVLSPEIGRLVELADLDLSFNLLETLPSQIGECAQLIRIDVSHNQLLALPYSLSKCPLSQLLVADNPLNALPTKVKTDPKSIWSYLRQNYLEKPQERWNRLRLMVVGPENIGKTRLIRRLSRKDYAPLSTDGIEVETFKLKIQKQKAGDSKYTSFDIRAYDFGGQEVFYPTHSFFIGPRSLYIAAFKLSADIDAINWQSLEYWLRTIKLLAGSETDKPSVIIAGTYLDEFESRAPSDHQRDILNAITKRIHTYDTLVHIRSVCFFSNKSKKGLDSLRMAVLARAEKEDVMKTPIPASWVAMDKFLNCLIQKSAVLPNGATSGSSSAITNSSSSSNVMLSSSPAPSMSSIAGKDSKSGSSFSIRSTASSSSQSVQSLRFISWQQFVEYAHMLNVNKDEEVREMATFLHDMGSILWFNSTTMREVVILDPQWLSEVMASIISMKVRWKDGELPHSALANIWKAYPANLHPTLLSFLEHFEVAYPLKGTDKTIVPCMFNDEPGDIYKAEAAIIANNAERVSKFARKYRFRGFLPLGFFDRMIVRIMHVQGVKLTSSWRYGIVMRTASGSAGHVSFESSKKVLMVTVVARSNTDILFPSILDSIESLIKTSYRNVKVARKVVAASPLVSALQPEEFDYDAVLDAFHRGERTFMCGKVAVPIEDMAPDICMCFIPELKNVKIGDPIGRGGFGVVYRGSWSNADVAVKEVLFKSALSSANTDAFRQFAHEVWIMSKLSHPNLVHLHGITLHPLRMIMEFCPGMDLCNFLTTNPKVASAPQYDLLRLRIALDVAKGMQYLHNLSPPVIHRDLRSPNVFVVSGDDNSEIVAKIGDFGLAEFTAHGLNEALPTWQWLPPETFNAIGNFKYNERCDRWSYGIVLWEIYTGKEPYSEFFDIPRFAAPISSTQNTPRGSLDAVNNANESVATPSESQLSPRSEDGGSSSLVTSQTSVTSATASTETQTSPSSPIGLDLSSASITISASNEIAKDPQSSGPSSTQTESQTSTTSNASSNTAPSVSLQSAMSQISEDSKVPRVTSLVLSPRDPASPDSPASQRPSRGATICNVQNLKTAIAQEGLRPTIPAHAPHAIKELMTRCWHADPMQRPDFSEIISILQTAAADAGLEAAPVPVPKPTTVWRSTAVSQRANYFRHPISRSLHSTIPLESGVLSLAYNPAHTEIWAGCSDGNVRIFNCKTRVRNVEVHPVSNSQSSNARIHQLLYVSRRPQQPSTGANLSAPPNNPTNFGLSSDPASSNASNSNASNSKAPVELPTAPSRPTSIGTNPGQADLSVTMGPTSSSPSPPVPVSSLDRIWSVSDRIVVWNPESRLLEKELYAPHASVVRSMLFLESKQQVWTADVSGLVCVWDVNSYELVSKISNVPELSNAPIFCMCYIEDTNCIWMGSYSKIVVVDASTLAVVDSWEAHSGYRIMAMAVAGNTVWTGSELRICMWDKTTRKAVIDASTGAQAERLVEFGVVSLLTVKRPNDVTHVWSGDSNGTVTVWNADAVSKPGSSIFQVLSNHKKDSVHAILGLDDGTTVCTGSYGNPNSKMKDNSICLWQYD